MDNAQEPRRRYPVGIQTFSKIRQGNYVYVDKTALGELLRVVEQFVTKVGRQNHSGGGYGSGKASAAGFVASRFHYSRCQKWL